MEMTMVYMKQNHGQQQKQQQQKKMYNITKENHHKSNTIRKKMDHNNTREKMDHKTIRKSNQNMEKNKYSILLCFYSLIHFMTTLLQKVVLELPFAQ